MTLVGRTAGVPDRARARFSTAVHWSHGTGAALMLPALGVTPPVNHWGSTEGGIDLFHHLVYETAAGLVHQAL
jgi:hypothetical protein